MSHLFQLHKFGEKRVVEGGERITATKKNFPLLAGMSLYYLTLKQNAIREPHWHANADELGYCLKGKVLISFYANYNECESFIVQAGEVFFIPSGTLHDIENIGEETSELVLQFSNEEPEDFALSAAFGMFSDSVLGNTWNLEASAFKSLRRSPKDDVLIALRKEPLKVNSKANYSSAYSYNLEGSAAIIANAGGTAKVARQNVWPVLNAQAVYSLRLTGSGMREPHWHPKTAELGFVKRGKGRMSILSPLGNVDTYLINEGDIYFIHKAYPHHIENLTEESLDIVIFFDQSMPGDIGFTASVKSFSDEVLTDVLGGSKSLFADLPTYYKDLFIVNKKNPLD